MRIIEIIPITKKKSKVITDEELAFVLYKGELSRYHLEEDKEIPPQVFREIYQEILVKRAKLRAMHLLVRMDYTEADLRRKLLRGGYTAEAVEEAISYVHSYHYLDDGRYVRNYFSTYSGKKSRRQMEFELERKGISRDLIEAFRPEEDPETEGETVLIRNLLEKRCKDPEHADEKERRRLYGYLARKGFSSSDIQHVFHSFFSSFHE